MKLGSVWFLSTLSVLPTGDGNSKKKHQETILKKGTAMDTLSSNYSFCHPSPHSTLPTFVDCFSLLMKIVLIDT